MNATAPDPAAVPADDFELDPSSREASRPFIGRWNQLVSTTNWEKGRIICQWREALRASGAPLSQYSDEAWTRLVGGVTGQHAGRLRRVYQRFGEVADQYAGLYWSHFQAALDWEDAEMWLEGALQNDWSVSQMRDKRWRTLGAPAELKPRQEDVISVELDEDFEPALRRQPGEGEAEESRDDDEDAESDRAEAAAVPRSASREPSAPSRKNAEPEAETEPELAEPVRPFENLPALPDDLEAAFEAFKLAIVRHKADNWQAIARDDLIATLEALKQLALAPAV